MHQHKRGVFITVLLATAGLLAGAAQAQDPVVDPGWSAFVIREANDGVSGPPIIQNDEVYTDALEFAIIAGGQKAGLGTDLINGARLDQIATLHVDRLDDVENSGSLYGPYFNIWVTDGAGNYAVLANEPSDAEWAGSRWDVPDWAFLSTKRCKVYDTPNVGGSGNPGTSWVAAHAQANGWDGVSPLRFLDVADLVVAPPPVAYITDPANAVGTGAPDELGTNIARGFNWMFGDTATNYISGGDGFIVDNYLADADFPVENLTQGTFYGTIQAAIDDADPDDAISVAAGTYEEQLHITTDGLTITGAGAGLTTILALEELPLYYSTSADNYPIVFLDGCTGVTIADVTVDGAGRGNQNYRFQGVAFWNSGGSLIDVGIVNVMDTPFSGAQHGLGVYAYNDTGGPYTVNLTRVHVEDYQKGGIALNGTGLTGNLTDCTTIGAGPTGTTAQNGIQLYGIAGGSITGSSVSDNIYTGENWAAAGILLLSAGTVQIEDTQVSDGDPAIYCQDSQATVDGLNIANGHVDSGNGFYVRLDSGVAKAGAGELPAENAPSPFGDASADRRGPRGTASVTIANSQFVGQTTGYGLAASNYVAADIIDIDLTTTEISNWGWGIVAFGSGGEVAIDAVGNGIYGNGACFYADSDLTTLQDASGNYWGETDPAVMASGIFNGAIDYSPWLTGGASLTPGFAGDFSELWVDDDSPQSGTTGLISEGIDLVDGSTVHVAAGTYGESLIVDQPLALLGQPGAVLDGTGLSTSGVHVKSGDVTVDGFEIANYQSNGVIVGYEATPPGDLQNVRITGNVIHDIAAAHGFGIYAGYEAEGFGDGDLTAHLDYSGLVIENNEVYNTANAAVVLQSITASAGQLVMRGNHVHDASASGLWLDTCREILLEDNRFDGNGNGVYVSAIADGWYVVDGTYGPKNVELVGNELTDNGNGFLFYAGWPGTFSFTNNTIAGNATIGMVNHTAGVIDATQTWWGDPTGPYHPSDNPGGQGDEVSDNVLFVPYLTGVVVSTPDPLDLTAAQPTGTTTVSYLGGHGPCYGYSVTVLLDETIATASLTPPASGPFAGVQTFQVLPITGGYRVDAALGGVQPGVPAADLFAIEFTATGGPGTVAIDFTDIEIQDFGSPPVTGVPGDDGLVRVDTGLPAVTGVEITDTTIGSTLWVKDGDGITVTATVTDDGTLDTVTCDLSAFGGGGAVAPDGPPAGDVYTWTLAVVSGTGDGTVTATVAAVDGLGNTTTASDGITADNTAPQALTGVVALPSHRVDGSNHDNQIQVSWDDPSGLDANVAGVEFRYVATGGYPEYAAGAPTAPADHTGGAEAFQATGTSTAWYLLPDGTTPLDRDLYALAGFVYDQAGNYGPAEGAGGNTDVATSYYLGDVIALTSPGEYNGEVDIFDITVLANSYGKLSGEPGFDAETDVGPTDDYSRFGIPVPDDEVGFQDLMIFAMNFGEVSPTTQSGGAFGTPVFAWHRAGEDTWTLRLVEPCPGLKGLRLTADLPAGISATVSPGELVAEQDAQVFLRNVDRNGLDAGLAVMGFGVGLDGAGDLVTVKTSAPVEDLELEIIARDLDNGELLVEMQQATGVEIPTVYSLNQNYPNPFNPQTTIRYALPEAADVRLRVYGVDGRLVRTLVNETREAGHHEVVWRGVDDAGRRMATGTYFYVIDAGDFHQVRKMTLVK